MKLTFAGLALVAGARALSYINSSAIYTTTTICPVTYTSGNKKYTSLTTSTIVVTSCPGGCPTPQPFTPTAPPSPPLSTAPSTVYTTTTICPVTYTSRNKKYTSLTTSTIVITSCPGGCPTPQSFMPFTPPSPPLSTAPPKPYTIPVPIPMNATQVLVTKKPKTSYKTQNTTVVTTYCPTTNTVISVGTGNKTIPLTLSATTLTSTYATLTTVPVVTSNMVVTPPVVPITSTIQTAPTPVVTTIMSGPPAVTCPITQIGDGQPQVPLSCSSIISSVPAIGTPEVAPPPAVETPAVETPAIETPGVAPPPAVETPSAATPAVGTPAEATPAESASVIGATPATFTGAAVKQSVAGLAGGVVALAALVLA